MIKFGPSGSCELFASQGYTRTIQEAKWLSDLGLDCFEYSFGRGVRITEKTAVEIGEEFKKYNIEFSVHAPYFINLATLEEEKAENNHTYIFSSLKALRSFGGKRCVFHPGSLLKAERGDAMNVLMKRLDKVMSLKHELGYDDLWLCAETMGKKSQLGDLDEVIRMCKDYDTLLPCIDFGHLNARDCGSIKSYDDYKRIIEKLADGLGDFKTVNMHVHFSKIQYTDKGELRHLTFEDEKYGPDFEPLLRAISDYKLEPYIACESAGTQTVDALAMKNYYKSL